MRIYADLTFNSFYDIRRNDIISATQVDEVDPNSPTSVLVGGGAQVIFIHADRVEGAADYLVGAIRRDYLDESVLFNADGGDHPTTFACATDPPKCTGPIFCPPKYEAAF